MVRLPAPPSNVHTRYEAKPSSYWTLTDSLSLEIKRWRLTGNYTQSSSAEASSEYSYSSTSRNLLLSTK
jgi:hypothetical protein